MGQRPWRRTGILIVWATMGRMAPGLARTGERRGVLPHLHDGDGECKVGERSSGSGDRPQGKRMSLAKGFQKLVTIARKADVKMRKAEEESRKIKAAEVLCQGAAAVQKGHGAPGTGDRPSTAQPKKDACMDLQKRPLPTPESMADDGRPIKLRCPQTPRDSKTSKLRNIYIYIYIPCLKSCWGSYYNLRHIP